jgi:hypothetical protein
MKERPILFSGAMVRALLAGTKTQTRRAAKLTANGHVKEPGGRRCWHPADPDASLACPYGQPGDRLWVRETWQGPLIDDDATENPHDIESPKYCFYKADGGPAPEYEDSDGDLHCRWRPSIHMPRWASRITLEITDVRVERLQDISEADAQAEGLYLDTAGRWTTYSATEAAREHLSPVQAYRDLWEQINGPGSWDVNPWVWVVEFNRLG